MRRKRNVAEIVATERLQPSLLDRLIDEDPDKKVEARDRTTITTQKLRQIILRDLRWLMNSGNLATVQDLSAWPEAARSVINYGIPDLTGLVAATLDPEALERALRQAILDFEPRILPRSLRVQARAQPTDMTRNALVFQIEGELWAQPAPVGISLRTELDPESRVVVSDPSKADPSK